MDLKDCLKKMDAAGRLAHVHTEVDAVHELSGVAAKLDGGKAVVFEHVKGYDYPVSTGMWWNRENVAAIFDRSVDALPALFAAAVGSLHQNPVAPVVVDDAPAQQVTMPEVDLGRIPVPTHALKDGGPYFSNCIIVAKDPDTGVRNTSIHRLMVTGKDRLGLLMDMGRHLRNYYERAEATGEPLEITINNGLHPAYFVAATTPSSAAPIDVDELANMIVAASVQEEINGIINVCTGEPRSLADRVEQFLRDKNYKIKLDYGAFPDRPYDSPGTWGDPTKINRILANDTCKRA